MPVGPYGALLDAVRGVRWPARRPVPQGAPGAHHARSRGVAPEFAEYRPYRQGDDPKRLDWKLLARSDRAFVRLAPDHSVLGTTVVVDASASMDFAEKWLLAKRLAVGLAATAHAGSDPVGLAIVGGDGLRRLEPRTRQGVVGDIARLLDGAQPSGSAALADAVTNSAPRCTVISDCLGDVDALRTALVRHLVRGGEAYLVHVVSAAELDPSDEPMLATDPEDARLQRPLFAATRAGYRASFDEFRATIARQMRSEGVHFFEVRDDEPAETLVRRIARPAEGPSR
jgi:uncharacterized protein (DUF58 family)